MPFAPSDAHGKTHKANTARRSRQWVHVYESAKSSGDDEGTAITKANGVVKKQWHKSNPSGRSPRDYRPDHMKVAEGFAKQAGRVNGPVALRRLRMAKKVPEVKANDIRELGRRMVAESSRMGVENGKGPVVSRKKLWQKHTRNGGRTADVQKSFESSLTYRMPDVDEPGTKTVKFKTDKKKG